METGEGERGKKRKKVLKFMNKFKVFYYFLKTMKELPVSLKGFNKQVTLKLVDSVEVWPKGSRIFNSRAPIILEPVMNGLSCTRFN